MSIESVKNYMKKFGKENDIIEYETSSATVELAAKTVGVIPAKIAKTLSFKGKNNDEAIIIVTSGDTKIDNKKFRHEFSCKAKMLSSEEAKEFTGHEIGGICPFAIENENVKVYLDASLKRFDKVYPAAGISNSAIKLDNDELEKLSSNFIKWVDICKGWNE